MKCNRIPGPAIHVLVRVNLGPGRRIPATPACSPAQLDSYKARLGPQEAKQTYGGTDASDMAPSEVRQIILPLLVALYSIFEDEFHRT